MSYFQGLLNHSVVRLHLLAFALVFCVSVQIVHAESSALTAAPLEDPAWAKDNYQECGQNCIYRKGNESVSLDATYVMHKLSRLNSPNADPAEVRKTLHGYCKPAEPIDDCLTRYSYYEVARLRKMRAAIVENEDAAYQLKNNKGQAGAPPVNQREASKNRLPQTPEVISSEAVRKAAAMTDVDTAGYQRWLQEDVVQPDELDFVQFKAKGLDPKNPGAGDLAVADRTAAGLAAQKKAYEKAKAAYEKKMGTSLTWDNKDNGVNFKDQKRIVKKSGKPELTKTEKEAFEAARNSLVKTANEAIVKQGIAKSDGSRKPAGGTGYMKDIPKTSMTQTGDIKAVEVKPRDGADDFVTITWSPNDLEEKIESDFAPGN